MQIDGAKVLLTGANRGIGRALALSLRDAGATKIYLGARRPETLAPLLAIDDWRFVPVRLDITDQSLVDHVAAQAAEVNLLINNAGVATFGNALDVPIPTIEDVFRTNFFGLLRMVRALAPVIERNGGGAVANVLTLAALASVPSLSAYNASKAAAWSMTQSLRAALVDKGIEVHAIFPGAVDTEMNRGVESPKATAEEVAAAIVAGIAEGREDIFPDPVSSKAYRVWVQDHKKLEKRFARL